MTHGISRFIGLFLLFVNLVVVADEIVPVPAPKPDELLSLLREKNYSQLDSRLAGYQSTYVRNTNNEKIAVEAFEAFEISDPALEADMNAWVAAHPQSAVAHLVRGIFYAHNGWQLRGSKYIHKTSSEQLDGMQYFFGRARKDLEKSLVLDPGLVHAYTYLIQTGMALSQEDDLRKWLGQAIKADPYIFGPRSAYMHSLRPEWGGSFEAMEAFLQETRLYPPSEKLKEILRKLEAAIAIRRCREHIREKHYEAALSHCSQAVFLFETASYLAERAEVLRKLGRHNEAFADATKAVAHDPNNKQALQERAGLFEHLGQHDKAFADFIQLAEQGDNWAQVRLGWLYAHGQHGVKQDYAEAMRRFEKAAAGNYAKGQLWLGILHLHGYGVPRNEREALRLFRLAAEQGESDAMNYVGWFLWHGITTPINKPDAIRWWRSAAEKDNAQAKKNLDQFPGVWDNFRVNVEDGIRAARRWARDTLVWLVYIIFG